MENKSVEQENVELRAQVEVLSKQVADLAKAVGANESKLEDVTEPYIPEPKIPPTLASVGHGKKKFYFVARHTPYPIKSGYVFASSKEAAVDKFKSLNHEKAKEQADKKKKPAFYADCLTFTDSRFDQDVWIEEVKESSDNG